MSLNYSLHYLDEVYAGATLFPQNDGYPASIKKADLLADHYAESGLSVSEFLECHDLPAPRTDFFRLFQLSYLYRGKVESIVSLVNNNERNIHFCLLLSADPSFSSRNLLRDKSGNLFEKSFFKKLQTTQNLSAILKSIVAHDDAQAVTYLKSIPYYDKMLTGKNLERALKGITLSNGSAVYDVIMGTTKTASGVDLSPVSYMNVLLGLTDKNDTGTEVDIYRPEFTQKYGHALINFAVKSWTSQKSQAQLDIITKMVKDGADWYMGYMQANNAPSIYLDLRDREKNDLVELKDMVERWNLDTSAKRNKVVLPAILNGLPAELLAQAKEDKDFLVKLTKTLGKKGSSLEIEI